VDLVAVRRRFIQQVAAHEDVVHDRRGAVVERRRAVERSDADAGTVVIRPGFLFLGGRGAPVAVEIGLEALASAWADLVRWGADALQLESDEQNASGYLSVLLDEATESGALDGADDLVLLPSGLFGRRSPRRCVRGPLSCYSCRRPGAGPEVARLRHRIRERTCACSRPVPVRRIPRSLPSSPARDGSDLDL
jgi:hypothetical protein